MKLCAICQQPLGPRYLVRFNHKRKLESVHHHCSRVISTGFVVIPELEDTTWNILEEMMKQVPIKFNFRP